MTAGPGLNKRRDYMRKSLAQLLALLGMAALIPSNASAGVPPDGLASMDKAAVEFVTLLQQPEYAANPPRIGEDKVKVVFAALLDRDKIIGKSPYTKQDIQPLLAIFSGYFALSKVYIEHRDASGKPPEQGPEVAYQDELALLAKGMVQAGGALSLALTDDADSKPAADFTEPEKAQLAKYRMGVSQIFSSAVSLVQNPQYSEANKQILAEALAENGLAFRDIILVAERGNIANAATQALLYAPKTVEENMNAFINELKSDECTGLCALK
ncbi:MAG: hypothetical protein M9924_16915 [Rhizobiaceae bacterium]|nr:hypothetical protein [Rhizobiaceae bacterium]